jgi:hypothetical protein
MEEKRSSISLIVLVRSVGLHSCVLVILLVCTFVFLPSRRSEFSADLQSLLLLFLLWDLLHGQIKCSKNV